MALSGPSPMGLRLDSSTASTVSFARAPGQRRPASQHLHGFIGDRPGPYNASFWLEAAMPEAVIVNANIVNAGFAADMSHRRNRRCRPNRPDSAPARPLAPAPG